jgi:hypothetical protein
VGDKGSITAVIKYTVHSEGATEYDAAADALNLLVVVAVAFTFPLQFFAAAETLEHTLGMGSVDEISTRHRSDTGGSWMAGGSCMSTSSERKRTIFRCFLCGVALVLATIIPHLSLVIALLGAVCGGAVELVLPPALALGSGICSADEEAIAGSIVSSFGKRTRIAIMVCLLVFGGVVVVSGTYEAIKALADVGG